MEDKIKELLMEIIYKRFEKRLAFWPQVELENFIEISAQEIVKLFAIPAVVGRSELLFCGTCGGLLTNQEGKQYCKDCRK